MEQNPDQILLQYSSDLIFHVFDKYIYFFSFLESNTFYFKLDFHTVHRSIKNCSRFKIGYLSFKNCFLQHMALQILYFYQNLLK
jgi:hypothetical protein